MMKNITLILFKLLEKRKYLNDSLVYNYKLFSKISSDFLIQSYEIEEETFINDKESVTKSTIVVPKHCNEKAIKDDIEKTDTILGHYSLEKFDLTNINYITSNYLVGEKFNTQKKKDKNRDILISQTYKPTTSDSYKKMVYKFDKKNI